MTTNNNIIFNITLKELEAACCYAREHGETKHKTIEMRYISGSLGSVIQVSTEGTNNVLDITNIEAW